MKKINSIVQLSDLLSSYLRKGVLTNSYTMLSGYKEYIKKGELFFEETKGRMVIFRDCKTHWKVFYYLKDFNAELSLPQDKPSVIEIIFRERDNKSKNVISYWESKGFKQYIEKRRMSIVSTEFNLEYFKEGAASFAKPHHAICVQDMISDAFDEYLGSIPSSLEVLEAIENNEVICIENDNGQIDGVLHIEQKGNVYFILHLVVDSKARKKGNAKKMLSYFSTIIPKDEKTKIQLWVREDNISARSLYEKTGFKYDDWKSIGLLYEPKITSFK